MLRESSLLKARPTAADPFNQSPAADVSITRSTSASGPRFTAIVTSTPSLAASTACLPPLPPAETKNILPITDSPAAEIGAVATMSGLLLPVTIIGPNFLEITDHM